LEVKLFEEDTYKNHAQQNVYMMILKPSKGGCRQ
jgi:hypothetical protein